MSGYRYDTETGLYYLQSRYYNPEWGRFINADGVSILTAQNELLGKNLFTYCTNNPVNNSDDTGYWKLPNWAKVVIGVVAVTAAVVLTGGAAAPMLISVAVNTLSGAVIGGLANGTQGIIDGACDGFMWGGIFAFGSAAGEAIKIANYTSGTPNQIGKIGEKISGIIKNTQKIRINGRWRIPDGLTSKLLQEVKNVKSLSLTTQLKDSMQYARATGRVMELYIRPNTYMSGPLKDAITDYGVIVKYLW